MNALAPISTFKVELVTLASIFIFSAEDHVTLGKRHILTWNYLPFLLTQDYSRES